MTVTTNLVVALMIVTNGEEAVRARVINESPQPPESVWVVNVSGPVETLYRKTCTTNYVYSADVHIERLSAWCHVPGCDKRKQFTAEDAFGHDVQRFGIRWDEPIYCKEHEKVEVKE